MFLFKFLPKACTSTPAQTDPLQLSNFREQKRHGMGKNVFLYSWQDWYRILFIMRHSYGLFHSVSPFYTVVFAINNHGHMKNHPAQLIASKIIFLFKCWNNFFFHLEQSFLLAWKQLFRFEPLLLEGVLNTLRKFSTSGTEQPLKYSACKSEKLEKHINSVFFRKLLFLHDFEMFQSIYNSFILLFLGISL